MRKIERLTADQESRLPAYREEQRARGLRLQWASDDQMREKVIELYRSAGFDAPAVLVLDSPLMCLAARHVLKNTNFKDQLEGQLRGQLGGQLRGQLGGQLGGQLRGQLGGQLRGQLRGQLGGQLRDQLWGQLEGQLRGQPEYQSLWFAGGSEKYWIVHFKFAQDIGINLSDSQSRWLDAWDEYGDTCGCLYPYDGIAFVSRRPTALSFDGDRLLHAETGPAILFADGFSVHAWHGTRVPARWIEDTDNVDPAEVLKSENVEQRAAGASIIGWAKIADKLDRKVIDGDPESDVGALVELTMPGLPEPGRFLMAKCPRNGTICEGVPRTSDIDGKPIETAIAAQAWRDCLPQDDYDHPAIRT